MNAADHVLWRWMIWLWHRVGVKQGPVWKQCCRQSVPLSIFCMVFFPPILGLPHLPIFIFILFFSFFRSLTDLLLDGLVDWPVHFLFCSCCFCFCFVFRLSFHWLTDYLIDWLIEWLIVSCLIFFYLSFHWLLDWPVDRLAHWLINLFIFPSLQRDWWTDWSTSSFFLSLHIDAKR